MGRTALYRDFVPWRPARAEVNLEPDVLQLRLPDGRVRRYSLDGCTPATLDGCVAARVDIGYGVASERRFVRMLVLERADASDVLITPPDRGAVAPNVVQVPEAPAEAPIIDERAWEALAAWLLSGGRLAAFTIADLAMLAGIASPQFAALIGEVAADRALELVWTSSGPLRGDGDIETALRPLVDAARHSMRAGEALVAALAYVAGRARQRRRG